MRRPDAIDEPTGRDRDDGSEVPVEVPVVDGATRRPGDGATARTRGGRRGTPSVAAAPPGPVRPTARTAIAVTLGLAAAIVGGSIAVQVWADDGGPAAEPAVPSTTAQLAPPDTLAPLVPRTTPSPNDPLAGRPPLSLRVIDVDVEADLTAGVVALDDADDLASETFVEHGPDGFAQHLTVTRDGDTGRLAVTVRSTGVEERVIVDGREGVGYVRRGASAWETFAATERVVRFWEGLLRGPLTPDLLADDARVTVERGPVVEVDDPVGAPSVLARAFRVGAEARHFAPWTPFALGPLDGSTSTRPTTPVEVIALVTPGDRLVELRWQVPFGESEQVVIHRPSTAVDADVALPPAGDVVGAATDWIIVPR